MAHLGMWRDVVGHGPGQDGRALLAEHGGKVLFGLGRESAALAAHCYEEV